MRLHDTARDAVVEFTPGRTVTMYVCGITPYDATHVGHAATYVLYDVLQRRLHDLGHEVRLVRNITDIDDDILRRAGELGVTYGDLATEETARFRADMAALNVLPPDSEPPATSAIDDMQRFIATVLERGHAYQAGGGVYFDVSSFERFGQLSHLRREEMLELAAERGGNPEDPAKRDPLDFVLWQPSVEQEPSWPSPWGDGRPGWHVECSTLAVRELGSTLDLHGGGTDLIFPHHECEAAQSESATGEPFARHWLHAPMVLLDGVKMSKSLGNLVFIGDLVKDWEPVAVRLAMLDHRYREAWDWHEDLLPVAVERLERWRAASHDAGGGSGDAALDSGDAALDDVRAALDDDLDLPRALAAVDVAAGEGRDVRQAAGLLGVRL
jgi:L-cysteine:1D-myo-inositol 2-amino-2-deoxy-alpha-D-glucopyranoside ligase